jgi:uncharacterized Tic20 family protein
MWAMFCHLAGLGGLVVPAIGSVIAPLVIWQIKKDEFEFVDDQGKEAVNFQISILIYALVAGLLADRRDQGQQWRALSLSADHQIHQIEDN